MDRDERPRRSRWVIWIVSIMAAMLVVGLLIPPTKRIRNGEAWDLAAVSLKAVGMALHSYCDVYRQLPPAVIRDAAGKPLYSWRVVILPFLEEDRHYREFKLDEPWDSPNNKRLAATTPKYYQPVFGGSAEEAGRTHFQVFVGPGTAFERRDGLSLLNKKDFPHGLDKTLLVVQAKNAVPWSKPEDLIYDPNGPIPSLGAMVTKEVGSGWFDKRRVSGFVACFADLKSLFIRSDIEDATMRALITRNGGEHVDLSQLE